MPLEGRRFRRRKKEDIFAEGFFIDHATDVTPNVDKSDESNHLYGKDSPEADVQHNQGTLTIAVLDKFSNNALMDLITGQDPAAALPKRYDIDDLTSVHVWANVRDRKNTQYIKSWLIAGWSPGMPLPSGDANAKAQVQMQGNGNLPRQFEGAWIKSAKVASGASPVPLGSTPVIVPGLPANMYAISVRAINSGANLFDQEELDVTPTLVTAAGLVWPEVLTQTSLAAVTHAMVLFLQTGAGIYPTVTMGKLRP